MPELPDLQVFRKNLEKLFKGKKFKKVEIYKHKRINFTAAELTKKLKGKTLTSIERSGKELFFHFDNHTLGFHLMLRGSFIADTDDKEIKYKILEIIFDDNSYLAFTDPRAMAICTFEPEMHSAPDALSKQFTLKYFKEGLKRSSKKIKDLITDQDFFRGIGNAYADEILWKAKVHPASKANKIPDKQIDLIYKSMKKVLREAEKKIEKHSPGIIGGEVRDFLKIHNSKLKKSPSGSLITKISIGGRKTYFTTEQKIYS